MKNSPLQKFPLLQFGIIAASFAISQPSQSAVTIYFEQDGSDVIATWVGTLALDTPQTTSRTGFDGGEDVFNYGHTIVTLFHISSGGEYYDTINAGSSESDGRQIGFFEHPANESNETFGFVGGGLYFTDVHISQGSADAVSELTFDPTRDIIRFSNTDLGFVGGADAYADTLAWTAGGTGDTISFTTGAPPQIPEPSIGLLFCLGSLTVLTTRRRKLLV